MIQAIATIFLLPIIIVGLPTAFAIGNLPDDRSAGIVYPMIAVTVSAILLGVIWFVP